MSTVYANGRSIVHQGDGKTNTAAPPDACKTPTPGGPVPIPYVNVAQNSDLAAGTKAVQIEGHAVAKADSNLSTSSGDEAGTAGGGLLSSKTKGKLTWATHSSDVLFEGQGAVRFLDVTQHNGNSFNTAFTEDGGTGLMYGDDFAGNCPVCGKDPQEDVKNHPRVKETDGEEGVATIGIKILKELRATDHPQSCMIAVARCDSCRKVIVAASGKDSLNSFADKVSSSGCGADIILDAKTGNLTSAAVLKDVNKLSGKAGDLLDATWASAISEKNSGTDGYNMPGQCAAQKIFATGHVIRQMSEMWYQRTDRPHKPPSPPKQFLYTIKATFGKESGPMSYEAVKEKAAAQKKPKHIGVASCRTCQALLPLLLCEPKPTC